MGISGLLPVLKSIHKPAALRKFAGQTIGIDAYGWLHRGTAACAIELATGRPTTKYVDFAMSRVRMLLDFGVIPYLVFDGDAIPSKAGTNAERRKRREESLAAGLELYRAGKVSQAHQELQKAAGVTPVMAKQFIEELKRNSIQYVVAPYEADAQLAYLEQKGIINGVLSEDSDLLVFGVKRLLTKLNQYGECIEIQRADFAHCKELSLAGWTDTMFRRMAILSGCDYLTNIPKMGLKTAYRYVRKYKDPERLLRMVALEGFVVPAGYLEAFNNAELTFMHHLVFCPLERRLVFLNELAPGTTEEDMPFLGTKVESDIAVGVACGDLNPKTKEPLHFRREIGTSRSALGDTSSPNMLAPSKLKPSKSIDNFFKPYRQPLAELDPNSLTPSPSAQRLLQQHRNASWEPRLVSSAPQLRRAAEVRSGEQNPTNTDKSAFLARASRISAYQPPKRQRLCSELDISASKEFQQSPFFTGNERLYEPSPLARKTTSKKHSKKGGFEVFSDSSIPDEAFVELADVQEFASPERVVQYPKLEALGQNTGQSLLEKSNPSEAILESSPRCPENDGSVTPDPVRSFDTIITSVVEPGVPQDSVAIPISADGIEEFEDIIESYVKQQNAKLRNTFVGQSPERRQSALASLASPKSPRSPKVNRPELSTFMAQSPEKQAAALRSLSSSPPAIVQRDTKSAGPAPVIPDILQTFTYKNPPQRQPVPQSSAEKQSHEYKVELAKVALSQAQPPVNTMPAARAPTSSLQRLSRNALLKKLPSAPTAPLPSHQEQPEMPSKFVSAEAGNIHDQKARTSRGSEDMLVSETSEREEEEAEEFTDAPEGREAIPRLDLASFVFAGR